MTIAKISLHCILKNMLELYDQGNLIQNIFKIVGVIIGHTRRANSGHEHEDP